MCQNEHSSRDSFSMLNGFSLSSEQAKDLALPFKKNTGDDPKADPCDWIPPSLLSADHIARYVYETGMVAPFEVGTELEPSKRLKAASYEGRIGSSAYIFEIGANQPTSILSVGDRSLCFPANSIVFVECDLEFRLPRFIAVRFNLQIRHVHRGLLLGTGPLVDPGFWGRLCIPIHNLTDSDYTVPIDAGLIWIEFTKTSSDPRFGRPPSNTELWKIKSSIDAASVQYAELIPTVVETSGANPQGQKHDHSAPNRVGIRSSIQTTYEELKKSSDSSAMDAKKASLDAKRLRNTGIGAGAVAFLAILISLFGMWYTYYSDMVEQYAELTNELHSIRANLASQPVNNLEMGPEIESSNETENSDSQDEQRQ
ncbi:MAG: hypothetical protein AAF414_00605 [Pseudomonadota bacterium]